jgi:hypothetical protein
MLRARGGGSAPPVPFDCGMLLAPTVGLPGGVPDGLLPRPVWDSGAHP